MFLLFEESRMMKKRCPKCGRKYGELNNYCSKCGIELEKIPNECTGKKTVRCNHLHLEDDDLCCPACGSLTTRGLEKLC